MHVDWTDFISAECEKYYSVLEKRKVYEKRCGLLVLPQSLFNSYWLVIVSEIVVKPPSLNVVPRSPLFLFCLKTVLKKIWIRIRKAELRAAGTAHKTILVYSSRLKKQTRFESSVFRGQELFEPGGGPGLSFLIPFLNFCVGGTP